METTLLTEMLIVRLVNAQTALCSNGTQQSLCLRYTSCTDKADALQAAAPEATGCKR